MEALDALAQARIEFQSRLVQIRDDQWESSTPCDEWNVQALVNHMMLGDRMTVQLLAGGGRDEVIAGLNDDLVGDRSTTVQDFTATADQLHTGFSAEGGLDGTVDHPMGEIPRQMFIGFRVCDYTAHAWDLARGLGIDDTLDADLVQWAWNDMQPMAGQVGELGIFGTGASGALDDSASMQDRYLDLIGRRP